MPVNLVHSLSCAGYCLLVCSEDKTGSKELLIRQAEIGDSADILRLRNEDSARRQFFDSRIIPAEVHERWYSGALKSEDHLILVLEYPPGSVVGYCRFKIVGDSADISVCLGVGVRGRGLGVQLICDACSALAASHPDTRYINALVKPGNISSITAFTRAGFVEQGVEDLSVPEAICLTLLTDGIARTHLKSP